MREKLNLGPFPLKLLLEMLKGRPYIDWAERRGILMSVDTYDGTLDEWRELAKIVLGTTDFNSINEIKQVMKQTLEDIRKRIRELKVKKGEPAQA